MPRGGLSLLSFDEHLALADLNFRVAEAAVVALESPVYAENAFSAAMNLFNGIGAGVPEVTVPAIRQFTSPVFAGGAFVLPAGPLSPTAIDCFAAPPVPPALLDIQPITLSPPPVNASVRPAIVTHDTPGTFTRQAPTAPELFDLVLPVAPNVTLPELTPLRELNLPTVPVITPLEFDAVLQASPVPPDVTFSFTEEDYNSDLLRALQVKLDYFLGVNSTGLAAEIWQAIWERAREREDGIAFKAVNEVAGQFAARGFSLPPGAMVARFDLINQENQSKISSLSRDMAIKEAEMEVENVRFAITQTIQLEQALIQNHNQIMQRAFEVARYTVEAALNIFNARVTLFNAQVQAYNTESQVYKARLEAQTVELEIYRSQLEGQRLVSEINSQEIEQYKAQIEALVSQYELYKAQLEGARFQLDRQRLDIEVFQSNIQAFSVESQVAGVNAQIYETLVNGERQKIDLYSTDVQAYNTQVNAYKALVEAQKVANDADIATQQAAIDAYVGRIEGFKAQTQVCIAELEHQARIYDSDIKAYEARIGGESARYAADVDRLRADVSLFAAQSEHDIGAAKVATDQLVAQLSLLNETVIAGARIAGQIASSALSIHNLSTTNSRSDSYSSSDSNSSSNSSSTSNTVSQIRSCAC